jgi:hypothetical protein
MSTREAPHTRAQGHHVIPYPPGMIAERDNCLVALEVILAREHDNGAVYPERTIPRVGWGGARATLEELVSDAYNDPVRAILLFEIDSIGWIDPRCPLRLERRTAFADRQREFVEALILPFGIADAVTLRGLLRGAGGAQARHEAAMRYARALEQRWHEQCPSGELPLRYLREDFTVTRLQDAPPARPDRPPVPATA